MAKSHWSFSGRYWAGWSGTCAALIAAVVSMPGASDKQAVFSASAKPVFKAGASPVSVMMERVDFGALPATAFGDYEPARERR